MKLLEHPAVLALGTATLFLLPMSSELISSPHNLVYHLHGSASAVFAPMMLQIGLLWVLLTGVFWFGRRPGSMRDILWTGIISALPWALLKLWFRLLDWHLPHGVSLFVFILSLAAFVLGIAFRKASFLPRFNRMQHLAATMLSFATLCALPVLAQLSFYAWQYRNLNETLPLHHRESFTEVAADAALQPTRHHRIIWLVLDELSYRQVYEHRSPKLLLPAFDRLATESTLFTHVVPAGLLTEYVIPSLISGVPADSIRTSSNGRDLFLHNPAGRWQQFDSRQTVFRDALNHGYSTSIAGWYNPYCRLMADVLDRCFWSNHTPMPSGMTADHSLQWNLLLPLRHLRDSARVYFHLHSPPPTNGGIPAESHMRDYIDLLQAADATLADGGCNFIYLHMPFPHPGGIYDRHTSQLTTGPSSYIDNLALADAYLAHLRSTLEQRGEWDSTTLLIMGDHSWRTAPMWALQAAWTPEEQDASDHGKFDDRPAYILKLPNQHQPARIDTPFQAVRTRALLNALMDHRLQSAQDLPAWVSDSHYQVASQ